LEKHVRKLESETVFCHGVLQNGEACWKMQKLSHFYVTEYLTLEKHVRKLESETVFCHGVLHNGEACWKM